MLQKPNVETENILKLANYIENIVPHKFDMSASCGTACCILGHAAVLFGAHHDSYQKEEKAVAELLGIPREKAKKLFMSEYCPNVIDSFDIDNKKAAKVLRHLAVTGKVDWTIVGGPAQTYFG